MRFLLEIQLSIFDAFHARLRSGLETFLQLNTSIGRTLPNVSPDDIKEVQGVKGLDRLCRIYGSAHYLETAMRDWSDDAVFLELWSELQDRVKSTSHHDSSIAGPLSVRDIAQATSSSLTTNEEDELDTSNAETSGALFDETASSYSRLRSRSEKILIDTLASTTREALRPYSKTSLLSNPAPDSDSDSPSTSLAGALAVLSESSAFLHRAIARAPLRRILKQVADSVQSYILDRVVLSHVYTLAGARQLSVDVNALEAAVQNQVPNLSGRVLFLRLAEAARLLCLDVSGGVRGDEGVESAHERESANNAETEDEEEESDQEDEPGDAWNPPSPSSSDNLSLWHVERRLFHSNPSARTVLEELGIQALSEGEARNVIRRRGELQ